MSTQRVAIVTGASSGLGLEVTKSLAAKNWIVYLACRDEAKTEQVITTIKHEIPKATLFFMPLDLCNLQQVKTSATWFLARNDRLDLLVNNAGIMGPPYKLIEGVESQFLVNHLSHFLLTDTLLPLLIKTSKQTATRIVNVSSGLHSMLKPEMTFDSAKSINKDWGNPINRYAQSKAANVLFTRSLNSLLKNENIYVNCSHPGVATTSLQQGIKEGMNPVLWTLLARPMLALGSALGIVTSAKKGAQSCTYLATSEDILNKKMRGVYVGPNMKAVLTAELCRSDETAKNLWRTSMEMLQAEGIESSPLFRSLLK